jgi:exopolyphosphatase / guanosine-5'-triphosphate,3'-diphosphate pyrophosphatase
VARFGVVDIGSNGIRMMVAEVRAGQMKVLQARREPVRLGEDVYRDGWISDAVMERVVTTILGFRAECDAVPVQTAKAIATAATREAANRDELVARVKQAAGIEVEVISGDREARLLCLAVNGCMDMTGQRCLLLDLGGGSIELATMDGGMAQGASLPLGALRLLRQVRDTSGKEWGEELVVALRRQVEARKPELQAIVDPPFDRYVVVGGSIETLADLARQEGSACDMGGVTAVAVSTLRAWVHRLAELPASARQARFQLPPERVDTIVPAAVVTLLIAELAKVEHFAIPRVDLRHGLLWELAGVTLSTGDGNH